MSRQEKLAALASTGVTKAELDNIDGGTARGTTAIADGDGVLINDAGTMRMTSVETMATYIGTKVGGGMEFIASSGAISDGTSSVAFTGFDASKYDSYKFYFLNVVPSTDDTKLMGRVSINGGSAYDSTSGNYRTSSADATGIHLHSNAGAGGASGDTTGVSGEMTALNPANTTGFKIFTLNVGFNPSDGATNIYYNVVPTGYIANEGSAVNAIKFEMLSGNIESGEITMFGIVNS